MFFRGPSESLQSDAFFAIRQCDLPESRETRFLTYVSQCFCELHQGKEGAAEDKSYQSFAEAGVP
jgi:hypothetical protein